MTRKNFSDYWAAYDFAISLCSPCCRPTIQLTDGGSFVVRW